MMDMRIIHQIVPKGCWLPCAAPDKQALSQPRCHMSKTDI